MTTPKKSLLGLKVNRLLSKLKTLSCSRRTLLVLSILVNDSELKTDGEVLFHPHPKVSFAQRPQHKMERAHFARIVCATPDNIGRLGQQLHVSGKPVAERVKDGLRP